MISIYPIVQTQQAEDAIVIRTKLVKEADGKYYYWNFYRKEIVENTQERIDAVNRFHKDVYHAIVLGIVDPRLTHPDRTPLFELAYEQISEEHRLRNYLGALYRV